MGGGGLLEGGGYLRGGREGHNRGFIIQSHPVNTDANGPTESVRGVRIKRVKFRENVRAYVPQEQGKLSVLTRCPY